MKKEDLTVIIEAHRLWLSCDGGNRADLSRADLRYANLSRADLSRADLRYANLSHADLRYANLSYADLSYADLSGADLSGADLRYANLSRADLRYANLSRADLRYADLIGLSCGNGKEVKSAQLGVFPVAYTATTLAIGCQQHEIADWLAFDADKIRDIAGEGNLRNWLSFSPLLFQILGTLPATPTGKERAK